MNEQSVCLWQSQITVITDGPVAKLITNDILRALPEIARIEVGTLHLFIQHTSASLSINENADSDVRQDMMMALDRIVPESWPYKHDAEGPDDMPAHIKSTLVGHELTIPVGNGKLLLGTWQGIYLLEHRNGRMTRSLIATLQGRI